MLADDREICTARGSPESQSAMTGSIEMMEDRSSARNQLGDFRLSWCHEGHKLPSSSMDLGSATRISLSAKQHPFA